MGSHIVEGYLMALSITLLGIPRCLQSCRSMIEILSYRTNIVVFQIGNLVYLTRLTLTEKHILQSMITQDARVCSLNEVVEVRHRLLVAQNIGQVVGCHRPCVGVGVNRINISSTKEECFSVFPIGTCHLPVGTSSVKSFLRTFYNSCVCIVIA